MSNCLPPLGERFHPPFQLAALVGLMAEERVDAAAVLAGTGIEAIDLDDATRRTSIAQYLAACRNAQRLSPEGGLAFRIGTRPTLSDHGLYGLLLLSCGSVRDVFRLATKYQWLAAPVVGIDAVDGGADMRWLVPDEALRDVPEDLRTFVVERQFAQLASHLWEVAGDDCRPTLACFAHPAPADRERLVDALGCPCMFDCPRYELRYADELLARRPLLANPLAAKALEAACDDLVADIEASLGYAGKVYRTLRRMRDPGARMKVVASELQMTDRTLRRRLANEGTCFSTISHRVRYAVATQHLKGSGTPIDEIATIAGFSDSANFRRAFIRWTNMSPARFRRLQQR